MTTGRPSDFNQNIADRICERMICGADDKPESLRSICRDDEMPAMGTVMRWLAKYPDFRDQYARTREAQAEVQQEEILEISDNCTDDVQLLIGSEDGGLGRINHSAIARAKLQIDTRKWLMSKMQPKKYGDKTVLSNDPENPLPSGNVTVAVTPDVIRAELLKVRDEF
jgi:hypothetical protein